MPPIIYSSHYNIGFFGLEQLHPFDSRKYGRAYHALHEHFGASLKEITISPKRPVNTAELVMVHSTSYLEQLHHPDYLARALEIPLLKFLPYWLINRCVLDPMRWATMGTMIGARESLKHGFVVNLGGGFHHAKPTAGEGFCIYADIALSIHSLRAQHLIDEESHVAYIDLDAHMGNGVCHAFKNDKRVFIFDMFNSTIYPIHDLEARDRIDCDLPLQRHHPEAEYLTSLQTRLAPFLDSISKSQKTSLAIFNAGTDVFLNDPLGQLSLTAEGILKRDLFVVKELRKRGIPTLMLLSGGYTKESYQLVANSVIKLVEMELGSADAQGTSLSASS